MAAMAAMAGTAGAGMAGMAGMAGRGQLAPQVYDFVWSCLRRSVHPSAALPARRFWPAAEDVGRLADRMGVLPTVAWVLADQTEAKLQLNRGKRCCGNRVLLL